MIQIQIQILDYIQCSPVDSSTVVVVLKHFWGQVLWRSAEGLKRRRKKSDESDKDKKPAKQYLVDRFACLCLCFSYVFVVVFAKKRKNISIPWWSCPIGCPACRGLPVFVFVLLMFLSLPRKKNKKIIYLGGLAPLDVFLAEAKVSDLDVAVLVQQQVLQLWKIMMNVMTMIYDVNIRNTNTNTKRIEIQTFRSL